MVAVVPAFVPALVGIAIFLMLVRDVHSPATALTFVCAETGCLGIGMAGFGPNYEGEQGGLRLIRAARDLDPRQTGLIGEALRASGIPALVLWGEQDTFLSIDAVGRPLAELLGAALLRLPGGHFTPLDCPREVATALHDFLARLSH
jgi:pimeloyl-ACP methyl ester carboxylesterase